MSGNQVVLAVSAHFIKKYQLKLGLLQLMAPVQY
jgi:hypothetical protein